MNDTLQLTRAIDFAAQKHIHHRRKGEHKEPYINHLTDVAMILAEATDGQDVDVVIAGLLHDTLEDTETSFEELSEAFGEHVATLVREVTDNKALPKPERKRLQVENAPKKSDQAKMIKIADKTSNLKSILTSPPPHWSEERKREYFEWAKEVVDGCRGVNERLEAGFGGVYDQCSSREYGHSALSRIPCKKQG